MYLSRVTQGFLVSAPLPLATKLNLKEWLRLFFFFVYIYTGQKPLLSTSLFQQWTLKRRRCETKKKNKKRSQSTKILEGWRGWYWPMLVYVEVSLGNDQYKKLPWLCRKIPTKLLHWYFFFLNQYKFHGTQYYFMNLFAVDEKLIAINLMSMYILDSSKRKSFQRTMRKRGFLPCE